MHHTFSTIQQLCVWSLYPPKTKTTSTSERLVGPDSETVCTSRFWTLWIDKKDVMSSHQCCERLSNGCDSKHGDHESSCPVIGYTRMSMRVVLALDSALPKSDIILHSDCSEFASREPCSQLLLQHLSCIQARTYLAQVTNLSKLKYPRLLGVKYELFRWRKKKTSV